MKIFGYINLNKYIIKIKLYSFVFCNVVIINFEITFVVFICGSHFISFGPHCSPTSGLFLSNMINSKGELSQIACDFNGRWWRQGCEGTGNSFVLECAHIFFILKNSY